MTRPTKAAPLDVITPGLIFRLPPPNLAQQLLCVIGLCFGAASFLRGLRLRRIRPHAPDSSQPISWEANSPFLDRTEKTAPDPIEEIIHLSSGPVPMKSAEMSQQQKIAAALARAGTSHSSAWIRESSGVAVEATEADPSENQTTPVLKVHSTPLTPTPKFTDFSHLLIWSGLALALLCCYLLVTFR